MADEADRTLSQWVEDPNRPSIWKTYGFVSTPEGYVTVYGMSDDFLKVYRPIFLKAYQCMGLPRGRTYRYPNIENAVRISRGSALVPDPPNERITQPSDYHDIIDALSKMVVSVVEKQPVQGVGLEVITRFLRLCEFAKSENDMEKLGCYGYFLTLNPLIYTTSEWCNFVRKTWYYWKHDNQSFEDAIQLRDLTFPSPTIMRDKPLKDVLNFNDGGGCKYTKQSDAVRFVANVLRHYEPHSAPENQIFNHIRRALPEFVPILFNELAFKYCINIDLNPVTFCSKTVTGRGSLIDRMNEEPHVISANDWYMVESRINYPASPPRAENPRPPGGGPRGRGGRSPGRGGRSPGRGGRSHDYATSGRSRWISRFRT